MKLRITKKGISFTFWSTRNKYCVQGRTTIGLGEPPRIPSNVSCAPLKNCLVKKRKSPKWFSDKVVRVFSISELMLRFNDRQFENLEYSLNQKITSRHRKSLNRHAKKIGLGEYVFCAVRNQLSGFVTRYREGASHYVAKVDMTELIGPKSTDSHPCLQDGGEKKLVIEMAHRVVNNCWPK